MQNAKCRFVLRATTGSEFRYWLLSGLFNALVLLGCFGLFDQGARCLSCACIQAGVQHVWVVAPPQQQVYVYQSPSHIRVLNVQDELTGDPFLPGFRLKLSELFDVEATEA